MTSKLWQVAAARPWIASTSRTPWGPRLRPRTPRSPGQLIGTYAAAKAVKATGKQGKEVAVLLYGEGGEPEQSAGLAC